MDELESGLVRRAQQGDTEAFDRLARMHEDRLLSAIIAVLGNRQDAYDAYQETLVRAFRNLKSYRFDAAYSTWMTRIAIRQALNWRRRWKGDRYADLDAAGALHAENGDASSATTDSELREAIRAAMETLSDRERTVFILKHEHGYLLREIAVMLDCAEGTVKNYLFRAVRKLRSELSTDLLTT